MSLRLCITSQLSYSLPTDALALNPGACLTIHAQPRHKRRLLPAAGKTLAVIAPIEPSDDEVGQRAGRVLCRIEPSTLQPCSPLNPEH